MNKTATIEELKEWADILKEYDRLIEESNGLKAKFQADLDKSDHWVEEKFLKESIAKLDEIVSTNKVSKKRILDTYFITD